MEKKIKEMIKATLNVNIDNMTEEEKDYPLLSKRFDVMPYQMLVFFTRIEKEFGIRIPDEYIADGKFNSYNDISKIICIRPLSAAIRAAFSGQTGPY